jgi:hypothetical protein
VLKAKHMQLLRQFVVFSDAAQTPVLVQVSGLLRNLVVDPQCIEVLIDSNVLFATKMVGVVAKMIEVFPDQSELMLNNLRILSKISLSEQCCQIMMENKECMKNLTAFFRTYRANTYIVIRAAFILAFLFNSATSPASSPTSATTSTSSWAPSTTSSPALFISASWYAINSGRPPQDRAREETVRPELRRLGLQVHSEGGAPGRAGQARASARQPHDPAADRLRLPHLEKGELQAAAQDQQGHSRQGPRQARRTPQLHHESHLQHRLLRETAPHGQRLRAQQVQAGCIPFI